MKVFLVLFPLIWSATTGAGDHGSVRTSDSGVLSYFVHIESSTINDPNTKTKDHVSLKKCAKLCLDDVTCVSFEHDKEKQICFLSRNSANKYKIQFDANRDYYQAIIPDEALIGMKGVGVRDTIKLERYRKLSLDECSAKCRANPKCKSLAYKPRTKLCNLNGATYLNQNLDLGKWGWDMYFVNQDQKEINCGSPPRLHYKSVTYVATIYKSRAEYRCGLGETFISTCGIDGKWSKPNGTCKRPTTCKEFGKCGEFVPDGEYWIYPAGLYGKKLKVYCSGMQTANPKEYVSLLSENYSLAPAKKVLFFCFTRTSLDSYQPGKTIFYKIRINPENLKVNRTDFTFAKLAPDSGNTKWAYGVAADCLYDKESSCESEGKMKIDLTGTGLAVDRRGSWTNFGTNSRMVNFKRSENGQQVSATCGGKCGGCKPLCIKLVATRTGPPEESAKTCENV
uniref:GON-SepT-1 n=1 Tax=Sepioteuthis australis TaxID=61682 RepID=R4G2C9_9MOLL